MKPRRVVIERLSEGDVNRRCEELCAYLEERWNGLLTRLRASRAPGTACDRLAAEAIALVEELPLAPSYCEKTFGPPPGGDQRRYMWFQITFPGAAVHGPRPQPAWSLEADAAWRSRWVDLERREEAAERSASLIRPALPLECADDGTALRVGANTYEFRRGVQGDAVRALWDANGRSLANVEIADRIGADPDKFRLSNVMRAHRKGAGPHPAMKKGGPIERVGRGAYRIRRS